MTEMRVLNAAEVRKGDIHHRIAPVEQRERQLRRRACRFRFEVPFALFAPAEADGTVRRYQFTLLVVGDGFPLRIVLFTQVVGQIRRAQLASGHIAAVFARLQQHQHRHIGVVTRVVKEVVAGVFQVKLVEDDVAHRHRQRAVGALLRRQPLVAQLGHF